MSNQLFSSGQKPESCPSGWSSLRIGELFDQRKEKNREDLPLLAITASGGVVLRDTLDRRDTSNADKSKYLRVCEGDIAYNTMRMWQGVSGLSQYEGIVSPAYTVCIPRESAHGPYMAQLFKLPQLVQIFHRISQGLVDDTLNLKFQNLAPVKVTVPPLPEQQKIAAILSSVDDVIEKTRAQIDKLKDLKTGMMQELLTKGIGHTEFKDSPVGRIPTEWECKSLGELAALVTSGSRGWAKYYSKSGPIFIRIGNLTREHINLRFNDTVHVSPPESAEGKRTRVQVGDVLISITADLGIIGVINKTIREAYVNQHISLVRLHDVELARWVGHFLTFENSQKQFVANNDEGAKAGLNLPTIRKTIVALPSKEEREKIVTALDNVDRNIAMKRVFLDQCLDLKKALMQDLLTGRVRVKPDSNKLEAGSTQTAEAIEEQQYDHAEQ